jgi:hypothetical protein
VTGGWSGAVTTQKLGVLSRHRKTLVGFAPDISAKKPTASSVTWFRRGIDVSAEGPSVTGKRYPTIRAARRQFALTSSAQAFLSINGMMQACRAELTSESADL